MVLTSHYSNFITPSPSLWQFLWTGVDLFFVISGFVFGPLAFSGCFPFLSYAIKRVFRIYPLYMFSLLLYYFATPEDPNKQLYLIKHILFLGTTSSSQEAFFFNPAYWSLPVEVEYYLLLPILTLLLTRHAAALWTLLGLFLVIRLGIIAGATPFSSTDPNFLGILKIHIPGILIEFLVGVALYWAFQRFGFRVGWRWSVAILLAGGLLWITLGLFFVFQGNPGINGSLWLRAYFSFLCALSYGLMLFGLLVLMRCKDPYCLGLAVWLGNLSYGVYLFHTLILRIYEDIGISLPGLAAYLVCSFAVILLSTIAHHLVERPLRRFGRNLARRWSLPPGTAADKPS